MAGEVMSNTPRTDAVDIGIAGTLLGSVHDPENMGDVIGKCVEGLTNHAKQLETELTTAQARIKELEDVLRFYADKKNWKDMCRSVTSYDLDGTYLGEHMESRVTVDEGKKAREVLK